MSIWAGGERRLVREIEIGRGEGRMGGGEGSKRRRESKGLKRGQIRKPEIFNRAYFKGARG